MSPALEGGFLTTGPPGMSLNVFFLLKEEIKIQRQNDLTELVEP